MPDRQVPSAASITRPVVQRAYDANVLTISRIRSDALTGEYWDDGHTLSYYEGRRDALKMLLEPDSFQDMGEPDVVTVTVEPGDSLNA